MLADGTIEGFVGGTCAESTVRAQSLALLDSGEPLLLRHHAHSRGDPRSRGKVHGRTTRACPAGRWRSSSSRSVPAPLVRRRRRDARSPGALGAAGRRRSATPSCASTGPSTPRQRPPWSSPRTAGTRSDVLAAALARRRAVRRPRRQPQAGRGRARRRSTWPTTAGPGAHTGRPRHRRADARGGRAVDPGRDGGRRGRGPPAAPSASVAGGSQPSATAVDPVCGMSVATVEASLHLDHDGQALLVLRQRLPAGLRRRPRRGYRRTIDRERPRRARPRRRRRCAAGSTRSTTSPTRPGDRAVLRRPAAAAAPARRRGRGRQDRGGQGTRRRASTPRSSGCSATRGSTPPRRCTSGTTPASCSASGWPRRGARPSPRTTCSAATTSSSARCCRPSSTPGRARRSCSSTRSTAADDEFEAFLFELLAESAVTDPRDRHHAGRAPTASSCSPRTGPATCTTRSSGAASTTGSTTRRSSGRSRSSAAGCPGRRRRWPAGRPRRVGAAAHARRAEAARRRRGDRLGAARQLLGVDRARRSGGRAQTLGLRAEVPRGPRRRPRARPGLGRRTVSASAGRSSGSSGDAGVAAASASCSTRPGVAGRPRSGRPGSLGAVLLAARPRRSASSTGSPASRSSPSQEHARRVRPVFAQVVPRHRRRRRLPRRHPQPAAARRTPCPRPSHSVEPWPRRGTGSSAGRRRPLPSRDLGTRDADDEPKCSSAAASAQERLRRKDFAACHAGGARAPARSSSPRCRLVAPRRAGPPDGRPLARAAARRAGTLRRAHRTAGDPVEHVLRRHKRRPRRLVLHRRRVRARWSPTPGCTSTSCTARCAPPEAEAFVFATRLTRLTRELAVTNPDVAHCNGRPRRHRTGRAARGSAPRCKAFNDEYGRRGMARGAVVVIVSDGWERDDPAVVASRWRGCPGSPTASCGSTRVAASRATSRLLAGMAAALPYVDRMVSGHSLAAMDTLLEVIRSS